MNLLLRTGSLNGYPQFRKAVHKVLSMELVTTAAQQCVHMIGCRVCNEQTIAAELANAPVTAGLQQLGVVTRTSTRATA